MSIIFLFLFFTFVKDPDVTSIQEQYFYVWGLFSIADALWARLIFGRK